MCVFKMKMVFNAGMKLTEKQKTKRPFSRGQTTGECM